jgi:hypothetical protein
MFQLACMNALGHLITRAPCVAAGSTDSLRRKEVLPMTDAVFYLQRYGLVMQSTSTNFLSAGKA